MKKIAKLSLVAAVAVAGLTTANAQPLEEAIKNVETSGSVVYRYNDYNNDNSSTEKDAANNNYKIALNLSSKVNEDVKFNSRFVVGDADSSGFESLDSSDNNDQNVDVTLSHAYFGYTGITNTTVNVGKQGLTTPWTVATDSDGNEQTGTGVLALSSVGPVTLAAAYFNQTNLDKSGEIKATLNTLAPNAKAGSLDLVTVGAIANFDFVTLDAWYFDMNDLFDTYTIGAKSDFDLSGVKLGIDARWVSLDRDDVDTDNTLAKIALTAKAGIVNAKVAYATTDKEGGITALDQDATTTLLGWNLTALDKADADYWQGVVGVDILSNLNLSANYGNLQYVKNSTDIEEEELYAQLTYKMSKNLSTYIRYGTLSNDEQVNGDDKVDGTVGRLQVEYTF